MKGISSPKCSGRSFTPAPGIHLPRVCNVLVKVPPHDPSPISLQTQPQLRKLANNDPPPEIFTGYLNCPPENRQTDMGFFSLLLRWGGDGGGAGKSGSVVAIKPGPFLLRFDLV